MHAGKMQKQILHSAYPMNLSGSWGPKTLRSGTPAVKVRRTGVRAEDDTCAERGARDELGTR